ncbi:peroxiredoxin [bacterium]|nr:peroxiredoxin [bacterium]
MLKEGAPAPDFTAITTDGSTVKLSDCRGKLVVLYFYPKDDTPGCTKEACNFRDNHGEFEKLGAVVWGVSVDDQPSHKKFTEKYSLPFPLIVDATKEISRKYGALNEERGVAGRITYLIGKDGKVAKAYATVKPDVHAQELLEEIRKH